MRYWWVNQNQTFRHDLAGGHLWSPKRNKNGVRNPFYDSMRMVALGDVVFSFADTKIKAVCIIASHGYEAPKPIEFGSAGAYWDNIGWRVGVKFVTLRAAMRPAGNVETLRPLLPQKYSPLQSTGAGMQRVRRNFPEHAHTRCKSPGSSPGSMHPTIADVLAELRLRFCSCEL